MFMLWPEMAALYVVNLFFLIRFIVGVGLFSAVVIGIILGILLGIAMLALILVAQRRSVQNIMDLKPWLFNIEDLHNLKSFSHQRLGKKIVRQQVELCKANDGG